MRDKGLHFITPDLVHRINALIDHYADHKGEITPESLFDKVTELLPIKKLEFDTVRRRIEGYFYASERIWGLALATGRASRQEVVKKAQLKPLSHYHYLTGSLEPSNIVQTRDDLLNDPSTALVKLRDDIISLARILPELTAPSPTGN